jgi:adenosylcobinamide kinase/adenosylcobinamide-phosphate guanylyltransferase
MVTLIIGGSGSGKSEYAEKQILDMGERRRIYVATMKPWDEECEKRIRRHRKMRAYKQFETMECYRNLKGVTIKKGDQLTAVLLECMSNLVSNELFGLGTEGTEPSFVGNQVVLAVVEGIVHIANQADDVIVVSNEVFSDGDCYSVETNAYRKVLGEINKQVGELADKVVEVVAGIPIIVKNRLE